MLQSKQVHELNTLDTKLNVCKTSHVCVALFQEWKQDVHTHNTIFMSTCQPLKWWPWPLRTQYPRSAGDCRRTPTACCLGYCQDCESTLAQDRPNHVPLLSTPTHFCSKKVGGRQTVETSISIFHLLASRTLFEKCLV